MNSGILLPGILTSFITLIGIDLVYSTDSCERMLHNAKPDQFLHHYQIY